MKICVFISTINKLSGGPSRSVPILTRGLAEVGCNVTLITQKTDDMNDHLLEGTNVGIITWSCEKELCRIEERVANKEFDLIHLQGVWLPIYHRIIKVAQKYDVKYIITPRGALESWSLQQKWLKKKIALILYQKRDLNKASCILATANMEANSVRRLGIRSDIAIIPNGVDVSEYVCRTPEFKSSVKKQILFLSRIHQKKGIEFLINAWEQLKIRYSDWNVVIAGNGEESYICQLKDLIRSKGIEDCVEIIPPVFGEAKHKLYCESSMFVLPTYSENFGMVIAEAMSCGVPCITTNGTPWQDLNDNQLGWCIELSLNNLINTISEAIELGQDTLFEMGQKCSRYINDTYQYTEVAKKNKRLYEWILYKGEKPEFVQTID